MALSSNLAYGADVQRHSSETHHRKTPYTPIFPWPKPTKGNKHRSPSNSLGSSSSSDYLNKLASQYLGLADYTKEIPPSRPSSPGAEARVDEIRRKAREAYDLALGEPASGKWNYLVELLRLRCTQGRYRWVRCHNGEESGGWSSEIFESGEVQIPETEIEWAQIEEGMKLKRKVGDWQASLPENGERTSPKAVSRPRTGDAIEIAGPSTDRQRGSKRGAVTAENSVKSRTRVTKETSQLGFPVVKRSSVDKIALGIKKGKQSGEAKRDLGNGKEMNRKVQAIDSLESVYQAVSLEKRAAKVGIENAQDDDKGVDSPFEMSPPAAQTGTKNGLEQSGDPNPPHPATAATAALVNFLAVSPALNQLKRISDISEVTFLSPSFPSQLETSTPTRARQKPPPIPIIGSQLAAEEPPFSLSLSSKVPSNTKSSVSPVGYEIPWGRSTKASNYHKRARPLTPPSDHIPGLPITPPQELKKVRIESPAVVPPEASAPPRSGPPATPPRSDALSASPTSIRVRGSTPGNKLPTMTGLIAAKNAKTLLRTAKSAQQDPSSKNVRQSSPEVVIVDERYPGHPATEKTNRTFSSIDRSSPRSSPEPDLYSRSPPSPLAGRGFSPKYTSTQHQYPEESPPMLSLPFDGLGAGKNGGAFFGGNYGSEYGLEGRVERMSEILERDVDFDGWLKSPTDEGQK